MKCAACLAALLAAVVAQAGNVGYRLPPNPIRHLTNAVAGVASAVAGPLRLKVAEFLPSRYDLRDVDGVSYLSPIRDQGSYGTCWTFATMAGLEWLIRRDEGIAADLSENNLANMHGFAWGYSDGGNNEMAMAAILREECPVMEALDPYPHVGASVRERGVRTPRKVVFVPKRTSVDDAAQLQADLNAIKRAVMAYGPLATSYMHDDVYRKGAAYYCKNEATVNHAVSIIGWDDGYLASNFRETPPGDGAFIIRNSWGTDLFENGYMYISYYDRTLGFGDVQVAYASLSEGDDYGRIYQYDRQGYIGSSGYSGFSSLCAANIFLADRSDTLSAVGFYALYDNLDYTVSIVRNASFSDGVLSGDWIKVKEGTCDTAGYEVIPFDTEVNVEASSRFAVVVRFSAESVSDVVPMSYNRSGYVTNMTASAGLSLTCPDPDRYLWNDQSANGRYFCCKVYAKATGGGSVTTSTDAAVPYGWLELYAAQHGADHLLDYFCGCHNALAEHVGANGLSIEASFVNGLDPDNASKTNLTATISFDSENLPVIGILPKNTVLWDYTVLGSQNLSDWHVKTAADRFFKVAAEPKGL